MVHISGYHPLSISFMICLVEQAALFIAGRTKFTSLLSPHWSLGRQLADDVGPIYFIRSLSHDERSLSPLSQDECSLSQEQRAWIGIDYPPWRTVSTHLCILLVIHYRKCNTTTWADCPSPQRLWTWAPRARDPSLSSSFSPQISVKCQRPTVNCWWSTASGQRKLTVNESQRSKTVNEGQTVKGFKKTSVQIERRFVQIVQI